MLADLIHHVRAELSTAQIQKTVVVYSANLLDDTLSASIQTMSAKLLLNMIDRIMKLPEQRQARAILMLILASFVCKLDNLTRTFTLHASSSGADRRLNSSSEQNNPASKGQSEPDIELPRDGFGLFKNLIFGMKTVLFGLKTSNPAVAHTSMTSQQWSEAVRGLTSADLQLFIRFFSHGIHGLSSYRTQAKPFTGAEAEEAGNVDAFITSVNTIGREEKDILETFATVFIHLDPASFQEIIDASLPSFFDQIPANATLLHIPQFFLTNDGTSPHFAGLLLQFLLQRLPDLGSKDQIQTTILLRLFKMCFMAVTMFPDLNESVLQPHLSDIILQCMKLSASAARPLNYYILMRALFRSIGGGRFELLYKEVLPLLQVLLESLNTLLISARKVSEKELFVELCLTVPVRLSVLLPYLSHLMQPLVLALAAGPDLVTQGLRTLELCIDNLTQEFLDPILHPVLDELMQGLWKHLKPLPHNHHHSHSALRILGKLGGRNRKFLEETHSSRLHYKNEAQSLSLLLAFHGTDKKEVLSWDSVVGAACKVMSKSDSAVADLEQAKIILLQALALLFPIADHSRDVSTNQIHGQYILNYLPTTSESPGTDLRPVPATSPDQCNKDLALQCVTGLFSALQHKELRTEMEKWVLQITNHLAILSMLPSSLPTLIEQLPSHVQVAHQPRQVVVEVLADTIFDALSSEIDEVRQIATQCLKQIFDIGTSFDASPQIGRSALFSEFATRFCHACFSVEWHKKAAATLGLSILLDDLELESAWYRNNQIEIAKALLFVIKDVPKEVATQCTTVAEDLLKNLTKKARSLASGKDNFNPAFVLLLVTELANPNGNVRSTVQELLRQVSEMSGQSTSAVLKPLQDRFLAPIFTKPLRALPFAMQIGHIDAVSYCLAMSPTFLEYNEELLRLLHEALALADAEDEALVTPIRTSQYKTAASLIRLRVVCLKLLTIAVSSPEFASGQQAQSRSRIIAVFFKSLYSKSPEVVEVANSGLQCVLSQNHKLPKDLLQAGLRPILMNLSDHKRLTVQGLEGLARLLELLTNYFKVEIGKKLLDHLKAWAEPSALQQLAGTPLCQQTSVKVMAAILNIFHLLPSSAHMFLDDLVQAIMSLEEQLRRVCNSPLRPPLILFINRYPQEYWQYLKTKLHDSKISSFLMQLLDEDTCEPARAVIAQDLQSSLPNDPRPSTELLLVRMKLICVLSRHETLEIVCAPMFQEVLLDTLKSISTTGENAISINRGQIEMEIMDTLLHILRQEPTNDELLFSLIASQLRAVLSPSKKINEFIEANIIIAASPQQKRKIIELAVERFNDTAVPQALKTALFKRIVNPLIVKALDSASQQESDLILDKSFIEFAHTNVWKVCLDDFGKSKICSSDYLKLEILQFSSLLLTAKVDLLNDVRKDLIKFAWNYIKLEDVTTKNTAYVFICNFVASFETPAKMTAQIFYALLRTSQPEARALVKQALNILIPVLVKRNSASLDSRAPSWIQFTRKVLVEESNPFQVIQVYQFIGRHALSFREAAELLLPLIIVALPKFAYLPSATAESRMLTLDLLEVLKKWSEDSQSDRESTPAMNGVQKFNVMTNHMQEILICSIRFMTSSCESLTKDQVLRAERIVEYVLDKSPATNVLTNLELITKSLSEIDDKFHLVISALLRLLEKIVTKQDHFVPQLYEDKAWIDRITKIDVPECVAVVAKIMVHIMHTMNIQDDKDDTLSGLRKDCETHVMNLVQDNLQNHLNLNANINVLAAISKTSPALRLGLIPVSMKVFNLLIKEHLGTKTVASTNVSSTEINSTTPLSMDSDVLIQCIVLLIDLISQTILDLGDQRRFFLAALAQLIERSTSTTLCLHILATISSFVLDKRESFPTTKEKITLLLKMSVFEGRGDKLLFNTYLQLISAIYKDPTTARTELTVRLEQAFLMGTRASDANVRADFIDIFNASMSRSLYTRLNYIFAIQNWEPLSNYFWITQANHLLIGSIALQSSTSSIVGPGIPCIFWREQTTESGEEVASQAICKSISDHLDLQRSWPTFDVEQLLDAMSQLQHSDQNLGKNLWVSLLPCAWLTLSRRDRHELAKSITLQLSKECHLRQIDRSPNVIQSLLEAITKCEPPIVLPPHLVKYLGKTFNAWYLALDILERSVTHLAATDAFSDLYTSTLDALTETYASLAEDDMFYGLWRVRCRYLESNSAISYEQNGMWDKAQQLYEAAQVKARTGVLPFSEAEYTLWEDHWILCAQKLQQWDVLTDLAKQEGYSDLLLECAWRISDWTTDREPLESSIKSLMDVPTPRRYTFEAFMALQKTQAKLESVQEFQRICEEGMQLSLRKWHQLPVHVSAVHIPLLQSFQQYVELQEASQIYGSLATTHAQNLEAKSHELKHILQTWRERLPNFYDDINGWSDLVAWRQLVFGTINRVYLPLVSSVNQQTNGAHTSSGATSFAYRGYHETAWIINRFAHVARKHQLPDVCISQLTKIYTLPNIEIQEAFLKLREQAKCHYQNRAELGMGLEVISNTNLMYFGTQQKAEFFTLKGMFLSRLKLNDEANQAFATAIQIDLTLAKAWGEWGRYSDRLFQEDSSELTKAGNAVSCYLQAAGLYKDGRARNMLSRVLWLLSLDDADGTIATAFDSYKGEVPTWYWITFIPQLLTSLSHKEARHARQILIRIAKTFPQALHFQLRTTKEDYAIIKKQALAAAQNASASSTKQEETQDQLASAEASRTTPASDGNPPKPETDHSRPSTTAPAASRQPWEHVDEIMAILKTAYPLLALSMESMVDQVSQRFKCQADEDAYRLIVALLNDGVQYIGRLVNVTAETRLPPATQANITRFADSVLPKTIKAAFEKEFVAERPNLQEYVAKLRVWRDKFESLLDRRNQVQPLEQISLYLSEFQYQKFDEVEIPGQYLLHRDNNTDFVRIERFLSDVDVVRGHGICYRRITIRGHDGSLHKFAIQYPAARHCRREERIVQLFRILSGILGRSKETRKRGLTFHLPVAIPLAPPIRIVQDDASSITLQGIYEDYCHNAGQHKDDPLRLAHERLQAAKDVQNDKQALHKLKVEILNQTQRELVPDTIVLQYFRKCYPSFCDFWRFRKHFTQQYASLTFMTYIMNINNRFPHKLFISRGSGCAWPTEIFPGMSPNSPVFHNNEAVPFRFTPTLQNLMGQYSIEGLFTCCLMVIARALTEPDYQLDQHLSVFVRDELITWYTQQHRPVTQETQLPEKVATNIAQIVRRASSLSQVAQSNLPAYQTILDLISQAVDPRNLAQMDQLWSVSFRASALLTLAVPINRSENCLFIDQRRRIIYVNT